MGSNSDEPKAAAIAVAEAIQAQIASLEGGSCAVLDLAPNFTLEEATSELRIVVTPQAETDSNAGVATRSATDTKILTDVAVIKKLSGKPEIAGMVAFCEGVKAALQRMAVTGVGINVLASISPLYDVNVFNRMKVFISVITVTTKVLAT